jgi:geranylgeranyl pyrophosphate synthase
MNTVSEMHQPSSQPLPESETQTFDDLLVAVAATEISQSPHLAVACEHILSSGGKHLRPQLVLAAAKIGAYPGTPTVTRAAVAIELFHCASLAHDDVIDDASARRGQETLGVRFGASTAALAGGWMFGHSAALLSDCGTSAMIHFSDAVAQICDGQMLEVCDLFDPARTERRYFQAIDGKTAVLFELSTLLGAELASAGRSDIEIARECGWSLGIAFQLLDDISDLRDSRLITGKQPGKDLLQGVYTLPVIYALQEAPELKERLSAELSPDSIPELVQAISDTQGPARALEGARVHAELAYSAAAKLPNSADLESLIDEALSAPLDRLS